MLSPLRFVLLAALTAALAYGGYFLVIDRVLARPASDVSESYKAFLLASTQAPRLVIDGGSSSHHGIDGALLTNALGRTTVNLGDNGGYPLQHKIHRLRRYLQPGDVLLLPLEWFQYTLQGPPAPYVDLLTTSLGHYYRALPLAERFVLARQVTLNAWARSLFEIMHGVGRSALWRTARLWDLRLHRGNDAAGGYAGPDPVTPPERRNACDSYLLMNSPAGQRVSDYTLRALDMLAQLQRTGVDVVLTAPTVVGDDCYTTNPAGFAALFASIRAETRLRGLRWLESPLSSRLPGRFFRDTPYHAIAEGRDQRTRALLSHIGTQWALPDADPSAQARRLDDWLLREHAAAVKTLPPWRGEQRSIVGASSATFGEGWSVLEPRGRWSLGTVSELTIDVPPDARAEGVHLSMDALYFATPEATAVNVCGHDAGAARLDQDGVNLTARMLASCGERVVLTLRHRNPVSPSERSARSDDHRKIKLFVRALRYELLDAR